MQDYSESFGKLAMIAKRAYVANHHSEWADINMTPGKIRKRFRKWIGSQWESSTSQRLSMLFLACLDIVDEERNKDMDAIYNKFKDLYMMDDGDEATTDFMNIVVDMALSRDSTDLLRSLQEHIIFHADTLGYLPVYGSDFLTALNVKVDDLSDEQRLQLHRTVTSTFKRFKAAFDIPFQESSKFVVFISIVLGSRAPIYSFEDAEMVLSLLDEHVDLEVLLLLQLNVDLPRLSYVDRHTLHRSIVVVFHDFQSVFANEGWSLIEFAELIEYFLYHSPQNPIDNVRDATSLLLNVQNYICHNYQSSQSTTASCGCTVTTRSPSSLSGMTSRTVSDEIHVLHIDSAWGNTQPP